MPLASYKSMKVSYSSWVNITIPIRCWMSVSSQTGLPRDWNPNIIVHWRWLMTEVDWWSIKISTSVRRVLQNLRGKFEKKGSWKVQAWATHHPSIGSLKKWCGYHPTWKRTFKVLTMIGRCCERTFPKKAMYHQGSSLRGKIRFPKSQSGSAPLWGLKIAAPFFPHLPLGTTPSNKKNRGLS